MPAIPAPRITADFPAPIPGGQSPGRGDNARGADGGGGTGAAGDAAEDEPQAVTAALIPIADMARNIAVASDLVREARDGGADGVQRKIAESALLASRDQLLAAIRGSLGGCGPSQHLLGKAIDVRLEDVPLQRLRDDALSMRRGGVGYYPRSDFVHLDTGRVRRWGR